MSSAVTLGLYSAAIGVLVASIVGVVVVPGALAIVMGGGLTLGLLMLGAVLVPIVIYLIIVGIFTLPGGGKKAALIKEIKKIESHMEAAKNYKLEDINKNDFKGFLDHLTKKNGPLSSAIQTVNRNRLKDAFNPDLLVDQLVLTEEEWNSVFKQFLEYRSEFLHEGTAKEYLKKLELDE